MKAIRIITYTVLPVVMAIALQPYSVAASHEAILLYIEGVDYESMVEDVTLDDVTGEHNPHMIGIWGGMLTHEPWFLRYVMSVYRFEYLRLGLEHFYALHGYYPDGIYELISEGFFPFTSLDPVTGNCYDYNSEILNSPDDYLSTFIKASENTWIISYNGLRWSNHSYQLTEHDLNQYNSLSNYAVALTGEYPTAEALRGRNLSRILFLLTYNYQDRTNTSPDCIEDIMNGMVDYTEGFSFSVIDEARISAYYFGVDANKQEVISVWFDADGNMYREIAHYTYWPIDGWTDVPSWYDLHSANNKFGIEEISETPVNGYTDTSLPSMIFYETGLNVENGV